MKKGVLEGKEMSKHEDCGLGLEQRAAHKTWSWENNLLATVTEGCMKGVGRKIGG